MNMQNKQTQSADQNPAKTNKGRAQVNEATHLEDEHTNGVTTTPTPEEVEDVSQIPPVSKENDSPEREKGQGKTVTPTDDNNS